MNQPQPYIIGAEGYKKKLWQSTSLKGKDLFITTFVTIPASYVEEDEGKKSFTIISKSQLEIRIDDELFFLIPDRLSNLYEAILKSKYILDLQDDWDENGGIAYDKTTWMRSIGFLINYAEWMLNNFNKIIITPKIYHGPNGGIDMLWENKSNRVLINIEKGAVNGLFYADNLRNQVSEGQFELENVDFILLPLPISV